MKDLVMKNNDQSTHNLVGKRDIVNTKAFALVLAEIYFAEAFGHAEIKNQKPFIVKSTKKEWIVEGWNSRGLLLRFFSRKKSIKQIQRNISIIIDKSDGHIVKITENRNIKIPS